MEIILLESLDKLGKIGDVVNVKDGFARNYLLPQKKALRANEENKKYYESIKKQINENNQKLVDEAKITSDILSKKEIIFIRQASDTGQLYGSVSPKDISNKLLQENFNIPPSKINLSTPIKNLGIFDIIIKLHADVSIKVTLNVATTEENAKLQKTEFHKDNKNSKIDNEPKIFDESENEDSEKKSLTDNDKIEVDLKNKSDIKKTKKKSNLNKEEIIEDKRNSKTSTLEEPTDKKN